VRRSPWPSVLLFAAPVACGVWLLLLGPTGRACLFAAVPAGAGPRALRALLCFGALVLLARGLLPLAHGAEVGLRRAVDALARPAGAARALLLPVRVLCAGLRGFAVAGFALSAVLVVAATLAFLLAGVWVVSPWFLGGFTEWAGRIRAFFGAA
jgi:hypothetical protein